MSVAKRSKAHGVGPVSRWLGALLVAASAAALSGCGQSDSLPKLQVYEVKGKVLLRRRQATDFRVDLVRAEVGPAHHAECDYRPRRNIFASSPGAPVKEHPRANTKFASKPRSSVRIRKTKKPLFPTKYTDEDSSGIVVTVLPQENHLEPIRLK